jgi:hypothetical protein
MLVEEEICSRRCDLENKTDGKHDTPLCFGTVLYAMWFSCVVQSLSK